VSLSTKISFFSTLSKYQKGGTGILDIHRQFFGNFGGDQVPELFVNICS